MYTIVSYSRFLKLHLLLLLGLISCEEEQSLPNVVVDFQSDRSEIVEGTVVTFTDNSSGNPVSWEWTFDGGTPQTSSEQNPSVTYKVAGTYSVTLTASNADNESSNTKEGLITVFSEVKADFEGNETTILKGQYVTFTDKSSGNPTSWEWTFEGGNPPTSNEQNPEVKYENSGLFEVKLKVSNEFTEDSMLRSEYLHVHFPIEADFLADVYEIPAGNEIQFMDESSGEPTSWLWEFEGGTPQTSEEQNPKVKYLSPGNYEVKLYAINDVTSDIEVKDSLINVNELGLAEITFEVTEHDFGDVKQGEILSHIFKLENTGDQPLLISNVLFTCGCMTVEWPKGPVPPGEKREISVTFDTAGKAGAQNKIITFIANTEPLTLRMQQILVKANVLAE